MREVRDLLCLSSFLSLAHLLVSPLPRLVRVLGPRNLDLNLLHLVLSGSHHLARCEILGDLRLLRMRLVLRLVGVSSRKWLV